MSHPIYSCGVCRGGLFLSHPLLLPTPFLLMEVDEDVEPMVCQSAIRHGIASGYFVIHVTIRTATTIGLVSGSWNVRASFLLSHCLLPWTVMACSNRESVFTFPSDHSLCAF